MNIRSIDLQVLIPRAADASRIQHQQDQLPASQQQQIAGQFQQLTLNRRHQVQGLVKSEAKKVHSQDQDEKERSKHGSGHERKLPAEAELNGKEKQQDPVRGKNIDIST